MGNNKYLKLHSFLRYGAALIAIIVFISLFTGSEIVHTDFKAVVFDWKEVFFGNADFKPTVLGFIGYLFVFIGGLAGLAFVFFDELIGKDLTKKLSYVAGIIMVVGGIFMLLTGVVFRAVNHTPAIGDYRLSAETLVYGILSIVAGFTVFSAQILENKGY